MRRTDYNEKTTKNRMPKKGHKSQAGVGDIYETPKSRLNISVTEEAKNLLEERALKIGISKSELIEQFARNKILPNEQPKQSATIDILIQIINRWNAACTPERRKLARWSKACLLIQELSDALKQS